MRPLLLHWFTFRVPFQSSPHPNSSSSILLSWISQDAYSEIAYLFAEFFRDLDIVPSDIIAGLVLLRQRQRAKRSAVLDEVGGGSPALCRGQTYLPPLWETCVTLPTLFLSGNSHSPSCEIKMLFS